MTKTCEPGGYRILARRLARELARPDALRMAINENPGALAHALRLLRWIGEIEGDDWQTIEIVKQSREVARSVARIDRAARRSHGRAWTVAVLARFDEYEQRHRARGNSQRRHSAVKRKA